MSKNTFTKSLMLHIRYPWTALSLLILWVGLAILCAIIPLSTEEIIALIIGNSLATLIIACIGFKG